MDYRDFFKNNAPSQIALGDCLEVMRTLPDESVHCCVTSPPYFGLRNYGIDGQIGLENTPQLFIAKMVEVFEEVRRILRPDGVLFLNLGDSYAGSWGNYGGQNRGNGQQREITKGSQVPNLAYNGLESFRPPTATPPGLKPKDLMLMPHRVAIALQSAGWWVRSDMPWVKRSAMPESVTDRPAKALEYVFMLTKSQKYFFDMEAVRVGMTESSIARLSQDTAAQSGSERASNTLSPNGNDRMKAVGRDRSLPQNRNGEHGNLDETPAGSRNFRNADLWFSSIKEPHGLVGIDDELVGLDVNPSGFSEAHFATFPPKLIEPLILAGTSEYGCCAECGTPWERILSRPPNPSKGTNTGVDLTGGAPNMGGNRQTSSGLHRNGGNAGLAHLATTTGWQKTCKCDTDGIKPCIALDPFSGAGTTGLVALKHRRRYFGIELNESYIKIAEKRLRELQIKLF